MQQAVAAPSRTKARGSNLGDLIFAGLARSAGVLVLILLGAIIVELFIGGLPAFRKFGFQFLVSTEWDPVQQEFGAAVSVFGTIVTAVLALLLAVPLAFGIAFYLTELAPQWLRRPVGTAIELLAAVPSIIYGMWGFFVIVPLMAQYVQPVLIDNIGELPIIGGLFQGPAFGPGNTIASIVALEFPESETGSLKLASLLALGFILFVISFIVLAISRILLKPRLKG